MRSFVIGFLHSFRIHPFCSMYQRHSFFMAEYFILWIYQILSIYPWMNMWSVSTFWLLWRAKMLYWTFRYRFLYGCVFISLDYRPRIAIAGSCCSSIFNLLRNCQNVFLRGCIILHCKQQCIRVPIQPYLLRHLLLSFLL